MIIIIVIIINFIQQDTHITEVFFSGVLQIWITLINALFTTTHMYNIIIYILHINTYTQYEYKYKL